MAKSKQQRAQEKAHALGWADRLMFLGPIETRALFGGWSFRLDGVTFASLMPDFAFRGDASVARDWEGQGARQFIYTAPNTGKVTPMPYWMFRAEALEDQDHFEALAKTALHIAQHAKASGRK